MDDELDQEPESFDYSPLDALARSARRVSRIMGPLPTFTYAEFRALDLADDPPEW